MSDQTSEVGGNSNDKIKVEEQFCENQENLDEIKIGNGSKVIKLEQMLCDDIKGVNTGVETKHGSFTEVDDQKVNNECQVDLKSMLTREEESIKFGSIKKEKVFCDNEANQKEENFVELEDRKFLVEEEIEIKTDGHDTGRFENGVFLPHTEVATGIVGTRKCLISNLEGDLSKSYNKHPPTNKYISKKKMNHCKYCSFETKNNRCLKKHLLVHKDPLEVTVYKCDSCSFQTNNKKSFKRHSSVHKDPSELTMYKCDFCLFQTIRKDNLKNHLLNHKNPLQVTMYKCDFCSYQTKHKGVLKKHLLKHEDSLTLYKCDSCSFQTMHKGCLKNHLLVHKDPSELTMYKCDSCSYQTKYKSVLRRHLLRHIHLKDCPEITRVT